MANYNSTYSGQEVDNAVGRALPDGTLDVDIRGKQDKLSQAQLNAVNSGINATKVAKYDGYEQDIEDKQDKLPDVQNDKYLHTNALTGELEWKVGVSKGTDDYNDLINKPTINGEEIVGDVSLEDLNVQEQLTQEQLDAVNSEVTSEWKNTIDGDITSLEVGKQDKLTSQQISNINRALVSPIATSTEKRIVAVDEQNNQIQVKIGENLSIEGTTSPFTLNAQGGGGESKLVEVTYGVTTYDEITQILSQSKIPYIKYSNTTYYYTTKISNSYKFGSVEQNYIYYAIVNDNNSWSRSYSGVEIISRKENTISPTSTTNYPSSKAVADYVAQHSGGGWTLLWENASPSSIFGSQTLNINSSGYNNLAIVSVDGNVTIVQKGTANYTKCVMQAIDYDEGDLIMSKRYVSNPNDTQLTFGATRTFTITETPTMVSATDNQTLKPYKIYGFN